jgi:predicted component of type VI protein secretion system
MFSISPDKLRRLEELVHELSNSVGLAAAYLELNQKAWSVGSGERLETALRLTKECRTSLASLMWEIGQIRISAAEEGHGNQSI